jgi:hypothetical protein
MKNKRQVSDRNPTHSPKQRPLPQKREEAKESFRLKTIQSSTVHAQVAWYSGVLGPEKTFRFNAEGRLFPPYNGEECQATSHPEWVLKLPQCQVIYYDSLKTGIYVFSENRSLRIEFWNSAEVDRFVRFCGSQDPGIVLCPVRYGSSFSSG